MLSDPNHEKSNFTFNDSLHISSQPPEHFIPSQISIHQLDSHDNLYDYQLKLNGQSSMQHTSTQNEDMETVLNFKNLKHITSNRSDIQETSRTNQVECSTALHTVTHRAAAPRREQQQKKPPATLNATSSKSYDSQGPMVMPMSTTSEQQNIRQFLYQTSSNMGNSTRNADKNIEGNYGSTTERSQTVSTNSKHASRKPPTHDLPKAHRFKPTSTFVSDDKPDRKKLVNQLKDLINLENSLETRQDEEDQQLTTFEVIESLIKLRQNHTFARRCQRLKKMRHEQHRQSNDQHQVTFSDTLAADDSRAWIHQSQNLFGNRTRSLPKLVLSNASSDESTSSCETVQSHPRSRSAQPRAVDSNKTIVTTFYVRGLLVKALKSFASYRQEQESKRFLVEATRKQQRIKLLKNVWQAFRTNQKVHDGHAQANQIAKHFNFIKVGRLHLRRWNWLTKTQRQENDALTQVVACLRKKQKQRLLKKWRTTILEQKMLRMQYKTIKRIVAQRVLSTAFYALRAFARYFIRDRYLSKKCWLGNTRRLQFKAFKSWQKFVLGRRMKASKCELASQLYAINLQRIALLNLKEFIQERAHEREKHECAKALRQLQLKRSVLILLKSNQLHQEQKRHRLHEIRQIYTFKLMQRFIKVLHATNIEFIERAVLAEDYLQRRKKRVVLYLLKAYVKFNRGSFKTITERQTYYVYLMLQGARVSSPDFGALPFERRLSKKYVSQQANATQLLKSHYKSTIFQAWKRECSRVLSLKQRFRTKKLQGIVEFWSYKAFINGKRRKKVRQLESKRNLKVTLMVFRSLRAFALKSRALKKTARKVQRLSSKKCKSRYFNQWSNLFTKISQETQLERFGDKATRELFFKKFFGKWRKKYLLVQKKRSLNNKLKMFQLRNFKAKFFQKWVSRTYKYAELTLTDFSILTAQKRKLMTVVFRAFQKFASIAHQKRELYSVLGQKRAQTLLSRIVSSWRAQIPELRQKRILVRAVHADYLRKLKLKVFDALRYRRDFARERVATDGYMTRAIQTTTLRRFFKRWEGFFSHRLGLQLLADSMEKLQLRTFFRKGWAKAQRDVRIVQHMHLFREFQLLQSSVTALHHHARRRDYLQAKILACMQLRDSSLLGSVVRAWRNRVVTSQRNLKMAFYSIIAINKQIKLKYFNVLKKRMEDRAKIRNVRRNYLDGLLRQVFFTFRNQIYLRKVKTFVTIHYRRSQAKKIFTQLRAVAGAAAEENGAKFDMMIRFRAQQTLRAWRFTAVRQKELRRQLEIGVGMKNATVMRDAFEALREACHLRRLARVRQGSIMAYVKQKHFVKAFTALLHATQSSRKSRQNKVIAAGFLREAVQKKVFYQLAVHMTRKKCHRQCISYLTKRRLLPKSFASLKQYFLKRRLINHKKLTALAHFCSNLQRKVLLVLRDRVMFKNQERDVLKQLEIRYLDRLLTKTFNGWTRVQFSLQERRAKRYCLTKAITDVDKDYRLSSCFKALANVAEFSKIAAKQRTMQILTIRKRHIYDSWVEVARNQKALADLGKNAEEMHTQKTMRSFFFQWRAKALQIMAANTMAGNQDTKLAAKAFKVLKLAVNLRKAKSYAQLWHQEFQQKMVIKALRTRIMRRQYCEQCVQSMKQVLDSKLVQKSLLSLKYFVLTTKGARLIQEKVEQKIVIKAFDSLKYQTISNRITKGYALMKKTELKQKMMKQWVARLVSVRKQKLVLAPLIKRLHLQRIAIRFFTWKQQAFRVKFLEKLQEHLVIPRQVDLAIACFNQWRKYSKFKRSAGVFEEHFSRLREKNTKRTIFNQWLASAIQQAPMTLFCNKLERLDVVIGARRGFQALQSHCITTINQENAVAQFIDERNQRQLTQAWNQWRKEFLLHHKGAALETYHNGQILYNALQTWKDAFYERHQERTVAQIECQAMEQAFAYYCQQKVKEAFTKMVFYLLRRRQKRQAITFRKANLAFNGLKALLIYSRQSKSEGSLATKQRAFTQHRQQKLIQSTFAAWLDAFKEESIVRSFAEYRARRVMGAFISQLMNDLNISTKLEKIGKHAEIYFGRRTETKTLRACFKALKAHVDAKLMKRERVEILAAKAAEYRNTHLKETVLREWRAQVAQPAQIRSKLYTVFSAWKFYTKERVLLKKYLFECGESIGDVSLMTTIEVKDSVRRLVNDSSLDASLDQKQVSASKSNYQGGNSQIKAMYSKVNKSLEQIAKSDVDDYTLNNINVNRSQSSLATRHFVRLNAKTSKTTIGEAEDSYDMRTTPMIMHKSLDTRFQHQ